jgi:hypothetical protein
MFNDDIYPHPSKDYLSQPLYVRQSYSIQIIQLVECSPPPPQQKYSPSRISSSSYSDDSQSDASSAYDSSSSSLSGGPSYCSSAVDSDAPVPPSVDNRDPSIDDTYRIRQRRVSLWRDAVYSKDVANSGSSIALVVFNRASHVISCHIENVTTQLLVPLLRPKSEKIPMVIWQTAIRS